MIASAQEVPADTISTRGKIRNLENVTIITRKPLIERKEGKTILNVEAMLSAGSNALELLEQLPGVQVNNDQLSLKGKQGVTVWIDDKPVYMQGADLANYLRALPTAVLSKIEIIPNPSVRYDAAGNGGIINIRLKKGNTRGWSGNISSENIQGKYSRRIQSANLSLSRRQLRLYSNFSYYRGTGFSDINTQRIYAPGGYNMPFAFIQHGAIKNPNYSLLSKAGIDWYVSTRTSWACSIGYLHRQQREKSAYASSSRYAGHPDTLSSTENQAGSGTDNITLTTSFRHTYDSTGRELTADMDYIRYSSRYSLLNKNTVYSASPVTGNSDTQQTDLPAVIHIYSFRTDYTHPFHNGVNLETGYKTSFVTNSGTGIYAGITTNTFHYQENIQAVYANYAISYRRLSVRAGIRLENTVTHITQTGDKADRDTAFSQKYLNAFPSVLLSFKRNQKSQHQWSLSYSRRIDRPTYADLTPFTTQQDRYTYRSGNPSLIPQLSDNIELSYLCKSLFSATLFYNQLYHTMDETIAVANNIFYRRPANISNSRVTGLSLDGTFHLTNAWSVGPVLVYTYTHATPVLYNEQLYITGHHWSLSATHHWSLPKGWSAELIAAYSSRQTYTQFTQGSSWYIHAGAAKKLFKDKATIALNLRDLFYSRIDREDFDHVKGITGYTSRIWDTRSITLALSYRFSKGTKTQRAMGSKSSASDENKRLGE